MPHLVHCRKLAKDTEGFEQPPIPGPLGIRIQNEISKEAFELWKSHQTLLINEYRLNLAEPQARQFLTQEMEKFLFGEGSNKPQEFTPVDSKS